ncbi:MAG: GHKL domain-containing protein [Lachnospiraceae bacterium]|nr:GHKL domain-containing protein [Lachnospiraceae bacterium]
MRIAVCDDSIREQEQLLAALRDYDPSRRPECFVSGKDLMEAAERKTPFDIAFLDIYMPGENGVKIAESLRAISPSTGIAFVTTSTDFAVDAFSLNALHYLVKPVTSESVEETFRRFFETQKKKRPVISFSYGNASHTVFLDEISYIQSVGHAREVHLTDGRLLRVWMPMEELEPKLDEGFLIQFGGGILLCLLPFAEGAYRYSCRRVQLSSLALAMLASALFPLYMGIDYISRTSFWTLFANLYMSAAIILFVVVYVRALQVETIKKMVVLILTLLYAATQYLLVGMIETLSSVNLASQVYTPLDVLLYTVTAALFLPFFAFLMRRAVREYLAEMQIDSIRREFWLVILITFLFFIMMVIYASGPTGLLKTFWWWVAPPMVMVAAVLSVFYWKFFHDSVIRKRENEERKTLEIQKIQYDNIVRDMEQTRILRHDMRHSLNHLSEMLVENNVEFAKSYLAELTERIGHRDMVTYCKNTTINGLLQYYVGLAADQNIQCRVRANCGDVNVSPVDLTILFGNLMENAINACEQIREDCWISVEIGVINGSLLIQAANPCENVRPSGKHRLDGSFLPAAAYTSGRIGGGYGLFSLERTAQKYGGNASFRFENSKIFTARVRLETMTETIEKK